jgi:uncharacterized LabA/DUF88 family protein
MTELRLKGKAVAYIDWANVYGWRKSLKQEIDPVKLFNCLKRYKQIEDIRLYFGEDTNEKSKAFLQEASKIGYTVVSKPVKYILVGDVQGQNIFRRKCDFDMEICMDVYRALQENIESFVFFTGDGDFEPLYKLLIEQQKQVIVVYSSGHLGREIWNIEKGLFKAQLKNLMDL